MQDTVFRTELTPLSFLPRSACIFPDKVAVIHDEREYTYREFNRRVNRFADALRAAGLQMHDRVALLAPNTPALLEAHFAVPLARGMLVAINTRLHRNDITYILKHSGARFLFVDATLTSLVESSQFADLKTIQINDTGRDDDPYEAFFGLRFGRHQPSHRRGERTDFDELHLRDDGPTKRCRLFAPRSLPERPG